MKTCLTPRLGTCRAPEEITMRSKPLVCVLSVGLAYALVHVCTHRSSFSTSRSLQCPVGVLNRSEQSVFVHGRKRKSSSSRMFMTYIELLTYLRVDHIPCCVLIVSYLPKTFRNTFSIRDSRGLTINHKAFALLHREKTSKFSPHISLVGSFEWSVAMFA